jgi:AcrR family transcriptional regulator
MVLTALQLLRERGADGVTLDALLSRSGAPRGSIYHHFPGGRSQILEEAVQLGGDAITDLIRRTSAEGPVALLRRFSAFWRRMLLDSDFAAGCPVVSVAVSAPADSTLADQARQIFHTWRRALTDCLEAQGLAGPVARRLANTFIAAVEGAVTMCRAQASMQPLEDVTAELEVLLTARALFAASKAG